jgi:stearoyl-CoA desaturase (delta-9 desaturase)
MAPTVPTSDHAPIATKPASPTGHAHGHDHHDDSQSLSSTMMAINIVAVVLPFVGLAVAIWLIWGWGVDATHLGIAGAMYLLSAVGVTIGYHRLFTHRSFECGPVLRATLAVFGSMAMEGPVLWWVAIHRRHHQHSDDDLDPHSPHLHGEGFFGLLKGLWHSHVGWLFRPQPSDLRRYVGDLRRDRVVVAVSRLFPVCVLVGLLLPAIAGGLLTMSWWGALLGFVWGGLVRVFVVHHITWSINSVCHFWGSQPFKGDDESRNNVVFGVLAMGEGWHNNHHAFPTSARHGLWWWQIDFAYYIIRLLQGVGLAWKVKTPDPQSIAAKRERADAARSVEH